MLIVLQKRVHIYIRYLDEFVTGLFDIRTLAIPKGVYNSHFINMTFTLCPWPLPTPHLPPDDREGRDGKGRQRDNCRAQSAGHLS